MKIWTITTDDDSGTNTGAYFSETEAMRVALDWCKATWERAGYGAWKDFADWRDAYEEMYDSLTDYLSLEEHDISEHPALKEALATLHSVKERLHMNNLDHEEDGPIEDCETAIQLLEV